VTRKVDTSWVEGFLQAIRGEQDDAPPTGRPPTTWRGTLARLIQLAGGRREAPPRSDDE